MHAWQEGFRKQLQQHFPDKDILLNKHRMAERTPLGDTELPVDFMEEVSKTYVNLAEKITGGTGALAMAMRKCPLSTVAAQPFNVLAGLSCLCCQERSWSFPRIRGARSSLA